QTWNCLRRRRDRGIDAIDLGIAGRDLRVEDEEIHELSYALPVHVIQREIDKDLASNQALFGSYFIIPQLIRRYRRRASWSDRAKHVGVGCAAAESIGNIDEIRRGSGGI